MSQTRPSTVAENGAPGDIRSRGPAPERDAGSGGSPNGLAALTLWEPRRRRFALKTTRRHRFRRWAIAVFVALVAGAVGCWLAFQHIPAWYRPYSLPPAEVQRVKDDVFRQFDWFNEGLATSTRTFQFTLTQDQVSEWLAVREEIWPLARNWLPGNLTDPYVRLENGAIRLAGTYRSGSLATVVSMRLLVEGRKDGLWITLDSIQVGSLPVPQSLIRERLEQLDGGPWPAGKVSKHQNLPEPLPPLSSLIEGARFPNSFFWTFVADKAKRPFWIRGLTVTPEAIIAEIEPLPFVPR